MPTPPFSSTTSPTFSRDHQGVHIISPVYPGSGAWSPSSWSSPWRQSGGILIRCPNHHNCFLLMCWSSRSTGPLPNDRAFSQKTPIETPIWSQIWEECLVARGTVGLAWTSHMDQDLCGSSRSPRWTHPQFRKLFLKCTYVNLKSTLKLATILHFLSAYDFLHCCC